MAKQLNNIFINTKRLNVLIVDGFSVSFECTIGAKLQEGVDPALVAAKLNEDLPSIIKQIQDQLEVTSVRTDRANSTVGTSAPSEFHLTTDRKLQIASKHVEVASDAPF